MTLLRRSLAVAALALAGCWQLAACSKNLELDVPASVHGPVHLTCLAGARPEVLPGGTGHLDCGRSERTLVLTRAGQPVHPAAAPVWHVTGDGFPDSIDLTLP